MLQLYKKVHIFAEAKKALNMKTVQKAVQNANCHNGSKYVKNCQQWYGLLDPVQNVSQK